VGAVAAVAADKNQQNQESRKINFKETKQDDEEIVIQLLFAVPFPNVLVVLVVIVVVLAKPTIVLQ